MSMSLTLYMGRHLWQGSFFTISQRLHNADMLCLLVSTVYIAIAKKIPIEISNKMFLVILGEIKLIVAYYISELSTLVHCTDDFK